MMTSEAVLFFKKLNPFVANAKYIQGVPNLDDPFTVKFIPTTNGIEFINASNDHKKFRLNKEQIQNIAVEDETTIQTRVGFTRMLLVGIFALAWKKRKSIPLSFLIFEYQNEFGEIQEMYIQSEDKRGFQEFTNIKYNLKKYWLEAENNPGFSNIIENTEKEHQAQVTKDNNASGLGCIIILAVIALAWFLIKS